MYYFSIGVQQLLHTYQVTREEDTQSGRHTLPSPRQFKHRCSSVDPHPGHIRSIGAGVELGVVAAPPLLVSARSCLSVRGALARMIPFDLHISHRTIPLAWQAVHGVAFFCRWCLDTRWTMVILTEETTSVAPAMTAMDPMDAPTAASSGFAIFCAILFPKMKSNQIQSIFNSLYVP